MTICALFSQKKKNCVENLTLSSYNLSATCVKTIYFTCNQRALLVKRRNKKQHKMKLIYQYT